MKRGPRIVYKNCRRCGKVVAGVDRPIFYTQQLYNELSGICKNCITPAEIKMLESPESLNLNRLRSAT